MKRQGWKYTAETTVNGITASMMGPTPEDALLWLKKAVREALKHHARPELPDTYGRPGRLFDTAASSMRRAYATLTETE